MPLFSFVCRQCRAESELLVRPGDEPACGQCGGNDLEKLLGHFAPLQANGKAPEPAGCGAAQCCQAFGGCMN